MIPASLLHRIGTPHLSGQILHSGRWTTKDLASHQFSPKTNGLSKVLGRALSMAQLAEAFPSPSYFQPGRSPRLAVPSLSLRLAIRNPTANFHRLRSWMSSCKASVSSAEKVKLKLLMVTPTYQNPSTSSTRVHPRAWSLLYLARGQRHPQRANPRKCASWTVTQTAMLPSLTSMTMAKSNVSMGSLFWLLRNGVHYLLPHSRLEEPVRNSTWRCSPI